MKKKIEALPKKPQLDRDFCLQESERY